MNSRSSSLSDLKAEVLDLIGRNRSEVRAPGREAEEEFGRLALALFRLQFASNPVYAEYCRHVSRSPGGVDYWWEIPALPVSAFKIADVTSLPPAGRTRVFHSSGTTTQIPSRHFHDDASLALYEESLAPWFEAHMLAGMPSACMIFLTPSPALAPRSSLVHMFHTVHQRFGSCDSMFAGHTESGDAWSIRFDDLLGALRACMESMRPVMVLGTAFNFVHLSDYLAEKRIFLRLPEGSRVMETGGYKGRSRTVQRNELHSLITRYLSIPEIVSEYGMSELSSQAYDRIAGQRIANEPDPVDSAGASSAPGSGPGRTFRFPAWARVRVISPETGLECAPGEPGLLRVYDLANVWSVMAVQSEDLAVRRTEGFELLGRPSESEPRGCSLRTNS